MRRTTRPTTAAGVLAAAALLLATGCGKPQADIADDCAQALAKLHKVTAKPAACEDLNEDDYQTLLMGHILDDNGWTNENGDFDINKLLEDTDE